MKDIQNNKKALLTPPLRGGWVGLLLLLLFSCGEPANKPVEYPQTVTFTHEQLLDKVKGGWAGQAIGVTFGSYTEFIHQGTFILDYQPIPWYPGYMKELMEVWPDLYDDIYMDLTFVEVFERVGLDAPVDSFAMAFAYADYNLWHANQAARYNIQHGIKDPGHWMNNPHADDLDYQIEADFAGIMSPGMPNTASAISDKIGHIMNYGDGWYGGVFVGAMYSLAYISDDIGFIVREALKTIPQNTKFHQCIADVIRWHTQFPDDWHRTWLELQRYHAEDIGCPDGVFHPFNIDARINAAYIVLGLLYGEGNFTRTLEISTRAGQDSDCNPSNAAGILGTMYGYSRIPEYWMEGIRSAEDMNFKYTNMSMNKIYTTSFGHALETIRRNGGTVAIDQITIAVQQPEAVRYEQGFEGMYPVLRKPFHNGDIASVEFEFEGTGFVVRGEAAKRAGVTQDGAFTASLYLDGQKVETANFPTSFHSRRLDLFWKYKLPKGKHTVRIVVDQPQKDYLLRSWDYIIYSDAPVKTSHPE